MVYGNVIGSSGPKLCVEESKIEAKIGVRAEAEAEAGVEEKDTTAGETATEEETAAEKICRGTERQCLWRERQRTDLDIGDKESGKRHSSDNVLKQLKTESGGRENDKDDTLLKDKDIGKEDETKEEARDEEVETWFEVREARFEVVAPGCILAP